MSISTTQSPVDSPSPAPPAPGNRTAWLAIGLGLSVILVGVAAFQVVNLFQFGETQRAVVERQTLQHPVRKVVFTDFAAGDVSVRAGGTVDTVQVTRRLTWGPWPQSTRPKPVETWAGDTLEVSFTCPPALPLVGCSVDYAVVVPDGTEVDVRTSAGDITLAGALAGVRASSSAGDVNAEALTSEQTVLTTSAGDVDVEFAEAPQRVSVESGAGDVDVRVPPGDDYRVELHTGAGDERVDVVDDPDSSRTLVIDTGAGDVSVSYR